MKKLLLILLCLPLLTWAQQTYVPDNYFETYLENNGMGNGIPYDEYVTTANINTVDSLSLVSLNITDLTGLEDFIVLSFLDLPFISVTSLDLSSNTELTYLRICNSQQITFLNLQNGSNSNLDLWLYGNLNLICVQVDNVVWATSNWQPDSWTSFSANCNTTLVEEHTTNKEILRTIDLLGRKTKNNPLFYIYDDGTVEKRITIE